MAELTAWAVFPQRQYSESAHNQDHGMCKRETLDLCKVPSNPALLVQGRAHSAPSRIQQDMNCSILSASSSLLSIYPGLLLFQATFTTTSNSLLHRRRATSGDATHPCLPRTLLHIWNRSTDLAEIISQPPSPAACLALGLEQKLVLDGDSVLCRALGPTKASI